ncbi:SDR family NAD(P)-dependent oxidoreductase [Streptomyces sp. BK340]|uniref:SDR family NAD(P)-dependent oxidoreductase n=1 Tax=Streptomyces sp. BK340 TaxID=2572903 RepID=UPI0011ACEB0C|nr:SDR family NAD(P)-dependent oxidoreductase [Streptomyces sp. BK340]TVZ76317.1 NADP-dependent 3-hydroxy acid dehydrogenase YdfG [Streptomyces sp. BK340]
MERLDGTVVLVTGASSGIGAATAVALAQQGAAVALVARRRDRLEAVARQVLDVGPPALCVEADVTDRGQVGRAVEKTVARFGRLDTVVNNAGAMLVGPVEDAPPGEWERMVAVNQLGLLYVTQAAQPHLAKAAASDPRHVADVVNIGSTAGRVARPGTAVYSMTMAGVVAFSESLRQELQPQRIRVSVVVPGTVGIGHTPQAPQEQRAGGEAQVRQIERLAPEDVARSVAFIVASPHRVAVNEILVRAADQAW